MAPVRATSCRPGRRFRPRMGVARSDGAARVSVAHRPPAAFVVPAVGHPYPVRSSRGVAHDTAPSATPRCIVVPRVRPRHGAPSAPPGGSQRVAVGGLPGLQHPSSRGRTLAGEAALTPRTVPLGPPGSDPSLAGRGRLIRRAGLGQIGDGSGRTSLPRGLESALANSRISFTTCNALRGSRRPNGMGQPPSGDGVLGRPSFKHRF